MQKFTVHTGRVVPLRRSDVDTDQIIPAVWLKQVSRTGFAAGLFSAWRAADPDFVLNRPEHARRLGPRRRPDFGTGSSREHAVWALQDFGFRVVLSPRFGDIFRGNSLKAGLLTVVVPADVVEELWVLAETTPAAEVTVDLGVAGGALRRPCGALRARRLHPLAAAQRARRHRPDAAAHRRRRRVRGAPAGVPADDAAGPVTPGTPTPPSSTPRWDADLYAANNAHHRRHDDDFLREVFPRAGARVLDLGCGVGDLTARLGQLTGGDVLGVDADPDMIATARQRASSPRLRFAVGRAQELDRLVPARSVDVVVSVAMLHWVPADGAPAGAGAGAPGAAAAGLCSGRSSAAAGRSPRVHALLDEESARVGGRPAGWYFPTEEDYGQLLADAGFAVPAHGWVRLLRQRRSMPDEQALRGWLRSQVLVAYDPVVPPGALRRFRRAAEERALAELRRADGSYDQDYVRLDLLAVPA